MITNIHISTNDIIIDRVTVAVSILDAFTGESIYEGIEVKVEGIEKNPIRNLSGLFVFLNLPTKNEYRISVRSTNGRYFDADSLFVSNGLQNGQGQGEKLRHNIFLLRRPAYNQQLEAAFVSGSVTRNDESLSNSIIRATFPDDFDPNNEDTVAFSTLSDEKGNFILALKVPAETQDEKVTINIEFIYMINGQKINRRITRSIREFTFNAFDMPIDIDGPDVTLNQNSPTHPNIIESAK